MSKPTLYRYATAGEILDGMYRELPVVRAEPNYEAAWKYHFKWWGVLTDTEDWRNHIANIVRASNGDPFGPITGDLTDEQIMDSDCLEGEQL